MHILKNVLRSARPILRQCVAIMEKPIRINVPWRLRAVNREKKLNWPLLEAVMINPKQLLKSQVWNQN